MKTYYFNVVIVCMLILPFFPVAQTINFSFKESEIRDYIPICTNNITCDRLYARIVESETEKCYEFLLYWKYQEGVYKFSEHENDFEFIVVYTYPNGSVSQVNFDSWHYYIGRTKNPDAYNDTNVLMFVDPDFHYFKPDRVIRSGNVTWQIQEQDVYELTDTILYTAKQQVGFDKKLYDDPFDWKEKGFLGRYTAFDEWYKSFMVVLDKKFEFIDYSNENNFWYKWL